MSLGAYIQEKFLQPYANNYYTLESTILLAAILVGAVWFTYYQILKPSKLRVDARFVYALIPFIILGGLVRSIGDIVLVGAPGSALVYILKTPGIYITMFVVALAVLWLSMTLQRQRKVAYWKTMIAAGAVLDIGVLFFLFAFGVPNITGIRLALGTWFVWLALLYAVTSLLPKYLTKENAAVLAAHMLDASATYTALKFHTGLFEEHWLARTLISGMGLDPAVMFLLKLVVVWPVLYYLDKDVKDLEYRTWLKIVVLILGLALGIHDLFVIGMLGTPNI